MKTLWRRILAVYWGWRVRRLCAEWSETVNMGENLAPGESHEAYKTLAKAQEAQWCKALRKNKELLKGRPWP